MTSARLISIVVPAMNEQENVLPFYEAVKAVTDSLPDFQWELLFVDDGSTDSTVERILALMDTDPGVRVLKLSRNFGSYAAIKAGFDNARGDAVISISADLQDPPELFRDFTAKWLEGYHIVWGVREQRDDPCPDFGTRLRRQASVQCRTDQHWRPRDAQRRDPVRPVCLKDDAMRQRLHLKGPGVERH